MEDRSYVQTHIWPRHLIFLQEDVETMKFVLPKRKKQIDTTLNQPFVGFAKQRCWKRRAWLCPRVLDYVLARTSNFLEFAMVESQEDFWYITRTEAGDGWFSTLALVQIKHTRSHVN